MNKRKGGIRREWGVEAGDEVKANAKMRKKHEGGGGGGGATIDTILPE